MTLIEKLAVLKMAGYEVRYRPTANHKYPWDWYNRSTSDESTLFYATKIEAVNQALARVLKLSKR